MSELSELFDSYFGFQDANLRIMFCTIFFEIVGWYWVVFLFKIGLIMSSSIILKCPIYREYRTCTKVIRYAKVDKTRR